MLLKAAVKQLPQNIRMTSTMSQFHSRRSGEGRTFRMVREGGGVGKGVLYPVYAIQSTSDKGGVLFSFCEGF